MDTIASEFGDEAVLEGTVESFAAAAGLRAVGDDELDGEGVHGGLKGRWRERFSVGSRSMAGADEVAGAVEVEGGGEAVEAEDAVTDGETAVAVFRGLKASAEGFAGGVVAGQEHADARMIGSEPLVWASVEEEAFAFSWASLPSRAMGFSSPDGSSDSSGSEEASEGLVADVDILFEGQGIGEV